MGDKPRPGVLLISGLDPTGGAGFAADVRLAERWGCRPVGVVTGLTVQDTKGVRSVQVLSPEYVGEQLFALLSDVEVGAVKIGMLGSLDMARVVAQGLALTKAPVVWDPVALPSHGDAQLLSAKLGDVADVLLEHLTLVTPNLEEAGALSASPVADSTSAGHAALEIAGRWNTSVLVTGGHLPGAPIDVLAHRGDLTEIVGKRVRLDGSVHGTGCALSTAIACALAHGLTVSEATMEACGRVRHLLPRAFSPGRGHRAVV